MNRIFSTQVSEELEVAGGKKIRVWTDAIVTPIETSAYDVAQAMIVGGVKREEIRIKIEEVRYVQGKEIELDELHGGHYSLA